jgi:hypothetical protein
MGFLKHFIKSAYYKHQQYNKRDYGVQNDRGHAGFIGISPMLHPFLRKGKKLIYVLIAVIGLVLLLCIALLLVLSPMILSGIDWVYHNGISGIVKLLTTVLDKLWKGAGT